MTENNLERIWTPEERAAQRNERIQAMFNKILPKIKDRKLGVNNQQPWLTSPIVEQVVKATIEELYDLDVE